MNLGLFSQFDLIIWHSPFLWQSQQQDGSSSKLYSCSVSNCENSDQIIDDFAKSIIINKSSKQNPQAK